MSLPSESKRSVPVAIWRESAWFVPFRSPHPAASRRERASHECGRLVFNAHFTDNMLLAKDRLFRGELDSADCRLGSLLLAATAMGWLSSLLRGGATGEVSAEAPGVRGLFAPGASRPL